MYNQTRVIYVPLSLSIYVYIYGCVSYIYVPGRRRRQRRRAARRRWPSTPAPRAAPVVCVGGRRGAVSVRGPKSEGVTAVLGPTTQMSLISMMGHPKKQTPPPAYKPNSHPPRRRPRSAAPSPAAAAGGRCSRAGPPRPQAACRARGRPKQGG